MEARWRKKKKQQGAGVDARSSADVQLKSFFCMHCTVAVEDLIVCRDDELS